MKNKIYSLFAIGAVASMCGCVNVDEEVSKAPSVYWKAPKDAMPTEFYKPANIKTDKIITEKDEQQLGEKSENSEKKPDSSKLSASEKMLVGAQLNLPELVDIALENNPTTRIYWFQAKQYASAKGKAQSAYYPQVSVGADVYRSKTKPSLGYGMNLPIGSYYETAYGPSAQISWLLYDFGKREAQVESTQEAMRSANFEFNQAIQDVFLNVNIAYYQYYATIGSVKVAELNLKDSQTSFESANRKLKDGVGNKQDMLNALASLKNAEFEVENRRADVETARANLANAMGVSASDIKNISENVPTLTSAETSQTIDNLIAKAMKSRQSLLASYAKLRQTQSDVNVAQRDFLPQISAQAGASYGWYTDNHRSDQYQYQIGLSASWSIFEGFARKYELISAKAKERAQAQELKAKQVQIISNIWAYYYTYQSAVKQVSSAEAMVKASQEAYQATKIGFDNGVNTITDLLNAQTRLATARQTNVNALASLSMSVARLSYAVGALGVENPQ